MEQVVKEQTGFDRFEAALYGGFASLALVLAAVGIYGLMALVVSERAAEMGLRMAMGANRHAILQLVLKDGCRLTIAGLVLGGAGAWYVGRLLQVSLYGTSAVDPPSSPTAAERRSGERPSAGDRQPELDSRNLAAVS